MANETDIAVVGAGCRFPDARTPEQFWSNVDNGIVSMRELSDEVLRTGGVAEETLRRPDFVRIGTLLPGVEDFAADFFRCSPRDARIMDPQQRIFLEACWEALEFAGHPPVPDGPLVGVFAGSYAGNYSAALFAQAVRTGGLAAAVDDLDLTIGKDPDFLTARVAYKLGLRGPAVSVQAACSSSLYAVHFASLSLLSGECDIALAGGATVLEPIRGYRYRPEEGQSEDGYCRSFDARSTGTTFSSGIGVVALRRLSDALADGDPVLAVLRGTAVGNDGALKAGFGAPSPAGVADVAAAALRVADVPGNLLRYVEAHGTATPLGDHVELVALTNAIRATTSDVGFCRLGSVKANIGHTGVAASIAGFLVAVHVARTGSLPPHPMFDRPRDPGLLEESPFVISTSRDSCTDPDRHVLVNSIGFGGTNAAAVLGAPPAPSRPAAPVREQVRLVLSARNRKELDALSRSLAEAIERGEAPIGDISHTLRVGRHGFEERRVVAADPDRLAAALRLPRPPLARTVRGPARRAVVVVSEGVPPPPALLAALPAGTPVVADASAHPAPEWYPVTVDSEVEDALVEAWLHGVPVNWEAAAGGRGRRVPLPAYPFERKRYWALDGVSISDLGTKAPAAAPEPAPSASTDDTVEESVLAVWRDLFGDETIGLDDEFGQKGGTSLLSVQLVLELQERFGVVVNVHRAGGARATVRRMADLVRTLHSDPNLELPRIDRMDLADNDLVDADLQLPLGPVAATGGRGRDVLLTGATGFLGAFLLHELLNSTTGRVYCLVRAGDEVAGRARLRAAAAKFLLPEPDPARVHVVPGQVCDIAALGAEELAERVGHVVHAAAKVVFTEPYRTLREDNVLSLVALLTWMRGNGIRDLSFVSSAAATAPAMGSNRVLETRDQPLDPRLGGYGVTKWVGERLIDRADEDGMRVRVFRPGLIMSARHTGAGNAKDLIYFTLASGVAVGAHPMDDRAHDVAPVDVVAKAIAELGLARGSVGRAYHLSGERLVTLRQMFELLGDAGLPTRPVELKEWQDLVRERALATGNPILATAAMFDIEAGEEGAPPPQATGWLPWLRKTGADPGVDGELLRAGLTFLARTDDLYAALLPQLRDGEGR